MFWDKSYSPSQNIEALLEKTNVKVEEFLDEEDILQECKSQRKSLVNYFTRPEVVKRLIELIVTEPSEELPMTQRFRHANIACEILTIGLPSLDEKILSDSNTLKILYSYLENEPPLNPLLSSFFSKTLSTLFTKKPEQDWFLYQQMCLQLLEYIKSQNNFLDLICKHFSTPVIPDLIMQMMKDVEGGALKRNLYEWLTGEKLVERLINILGNSQESEKHANVAEFLCDLIQQGRTMRQTESENDSFEPAFNSSNPILQVIESEATISALINVILEPNAQESTIVSGISVVLMLIKPVVFVDEVNSDRLKLMQSREKEIHEQILGTVIRVIAPRLKDFNELLKNSTNKPAVVTTAAKLTPPFGMTRLQICRVFTVLLQTRNEDITKAICETNFFENLLILFKQYCWNNFLHNEVEKCLQLVFYTNLSNTNTTQGSTAVNEGSFNKNNSGDNNLSSIIFGDGNVTDGNKCDDEDNDNNSEDKYNDSENKDQVKENSQDLDDKEVMEKHNDTENNTSDTTAVPTDTGPSPLQTHVIVQCKIVSKLIDCWQHNKEQQSAEKGRRLGYMGHMIKIFKHITTCISEFEHIGALIENNFSDAAEEALWQSIINQNDGDFTQALATQNKMLANCNAQEAADYSQHFPKEFLVASLDDGYNFQEEDHDQNFVDDILSRITGLEFTIDELADNEEQYRGVKEKYMALKNDRWLLVNMNDDLLGDDSDTSASNSTYLPDHFADFDAHFGSFSNDLGESLGAGDSSGTSTGEKNFDENAFNIQTTTTSEEYDNNANVEKSAENFAKFEDDENAKNEKVVAAAVSRFFSNDSNNDFDDDNAIWTKPLGSVNFENEKLNECIDVTTETTKLSNGPSQDNDNNQQNNLNDMQTTNDEASTTVTNDLNVRIPNPTIEQQQQRLEDAVDASAIEKKLGNNITAIKSVEIAPTS